MRCHGCANKVHCIGVLIQDGAREGFGRPYHNGHRQAQSYVAPVILYYYFNGISNKELRAITFFSAAVLP